MAKIKTQKIVPCLWFDSNAEDAVKFYTSVFKNSKIGKIARYGEAGREIHGGKPGSVLTMEFTLNGQPFLALNGGPAFKFTEAVSFMINCKTQTEIDYYWEKLGQGGDPRAQQCGWLKDKFGLSWQVVPDFVGNMMTAKDARIPDRFMTALLQMKKLDIKALKESIKGEKVAV